MCPFASGQRPRLHFPEKPNHGWVCSASSERSAAPGEWPRQPPLSSAASCPAKAGCHSQQAPSEPLSSDTCRGLPDPAGGEGGLTRGVNLGLDESGSSVFSPASLFLGAPEPHQYALAHWNRRSRALLPATRCCPRILPRTDPPELL